MKFEIKSDGITTQVEIDGKPVKLLTAIEFKHEAQELSDVKLELFRLADDGKGNPVLTEDGEGLKTDDLGFNFRGPKVHIIIETP